MTEALASGFWMVVFFGIAWVLSRYVARKRYPKHSGADIPYLP